MSALIWPEGGAVIVVSLVQAKLIIVNERFTQTHCLLFDYFTTCDTGYSFYTIKEW